MDFQISKQTLYNICIKFCIILNKWKEKKGLPVLKMFFLLHFQDDTISKSMTLFDTVLWYLLPWKHGTRTETRIRSMDTRLFLTTNKIMCYSVISSAAGYATKEIVPWVMAEWHSTSWEPHPSTSDPSHQATPKDKTTEHDLYVTTCNFHVTSCKLPCDFL